MTIKKESILYAIIIILVLGLATSLIFHFDWNKEELKGAITREEFESLKTQVASNNATLSEAINKNSADIKQIADFINQAIQNSKDAKK